MSLERTGFDTPDNTPIELTVPGVMRDGVDNTDNFNRTLNKLRNLGGGILRVPAGVLCVSGTGLQLSLLGCPIRIKGAGMGRSTIKHLTGGTVINWIGGSSHPASEFFSGIEHLTLDGNGGSSVVFHVENLTIFSRRHIEIKNGTNAATGSGMEWVSMWDSIGEFTYVDAGGGANPSVLYDAKQTGGFNGNSTNNCQEYHLHVENSDRDCVFLEIRGGATNDVDACVFYGLKLHGNAASSNPATHALLLMSQYAFDNRFYDYIIAYGKSTSQVICDGRRNRWFGGSMGIGGGGGNPTYAFQFTSNSDSNMVMEPDILTPNLYGSVNQPFRTEIGSSHTQILWPRGNYASVSNALSDGGRGMLEWSDVNNNFGWRSYAADGRADMFPGQTVRLEFINTLTDAANIAINARDGGSNKVTLGGNRNISVPTNAVVGQFMTTQITQDGVGGRTLTWSGGAGGFRNSWSDAGNLLNKTSTIVHRFDGTNWVQVGAQSPYVA